MVFPCTVHAVTKQCNNSHSESESGSVVFDKDNIFRRKHGGGCEARRTICPARPGVRYLLAKAHKS